MLLDIREVDSTQEIETDICIIGAGAAGITIARALINSGVRVSVLESGGLDLESDIQSLYEGENIGLPYFPLQSARLRYFGGTTNHWEGWCAPLDESDFTVRPWVPYSGWPIKKHDLSEYYRQAAKVCELRDNRYDLAAWTNSDWQFPEFHPDKLLIRFWQFSPPTRFAQVYRKDLERAVNVRVYLHGNVTSLETNSEATKVVRAKIRTLDGRSATLRAREFVLACGGIENARILLLSNGTESAGLGNRHDLVGRFFMEHPHVSYANVLAREPSVLAALFEAHKVNGQLVIGGLCPTEAAQQHNRILNSSAILKVQYSADDGFEALKEIGRSLRHSKWPDELGDKLWTMTKDLDDAATGWWGRMRGKPVLRPTESISLYAIGEQAPDPQSRVTLSHERDRLGLRRARLDWRLTELDKRTLRVMARLAGEEFGRLGIGRVQLPEWLIEGDNRWLESLVGGWHHMGTTRMGDDPDRSVVDRQCRVHGVGNLYIAGSSVFPTSGSVNPTLTIVALALRLSDQLKHVLAG